MRDFKQDKPSGDVLYESTGEQIAIGPMGISIWGDGPNLAKTGVMPGDLLVVGGREYEIGSIRGPAIQDLTLVTEVEQTSPKSAYTIKRGKPADKRGSE